METETIISINDSRITSIPIIDNNEPLVDMLNLPKIFLSPKTLDMSANHLQLRETVKKKLIEATNYLPAELCFFLREGHKSIHKHYQNSAPTETSPHATGGAFDITLATYEAYPLDMGTLICSPHYNDRNYTFAKHITAEQKANRQMLIYALGKAGFINYPTQWWHWSYGDRYWAYRQQRTHAVYDVVINYSA